MNWRLAVVAAIMWPIGIASAQPVVRNLYVLSNNHVRFDNGPELNLHQLRRAIHRMGQQKPVPDISLKPEGRTDFAFVARVLGVFQREGYNHIGFTAKASN